MIKDGVVIRARVDDRFFCLRLSIDEALGVVEAMTGGQYRWIDERSIVSGSIIIECDELEKVIEEGVCRGLTCPVDRQVHRFIHGLAAGTSEKLRGGERLIDLCKRRGWDDRRARAFLRRLGGGHRGGWVVDDDIARRLEDFFSK